MNVDRLLFLVAADANENGYTVPQIRSQQAHQAAERLIAAVGLTRTEPPRALPASPVDSATRLLPTVDPARRRGPAATVQLPVHRDSGYRGYGS